MPSVLKLSSLAAVLLAASFIHGCGGGGGSSGQPSPVTSAPCSVESALSPIAPDVESCEAIQFRTDHPRIGMDATRLASLQSRAGRLPEGSVAGPSNDENWLVVYPYLAAQARLDQGFDYGVEAWHFALAYLVTNEEPFADKAILFADRMVAGLTTDRIDASPRSPLCIARYPAELPRTDFAEPGSCLSGGQYLYAHYYVKNVALVYDWLHHRLSPEQHARYREYMRIAVDRIWNGRGDDAWALEDPANNYHYGYLAATVLQVLATWGEDDAAVHNWTFLGQHKWPGILGYLNGAGRGGYWHEGTHYGRKSKHDLVEVLLWLRDASIDRKLDLFGMADFSYPEELVRFQLHSMQPDLFSKQGARGYRGGVPYQVSGNAPTLVQVGDLASDAQGPVTPGDASLMAMLADGLAGRPAGEMAQFWLRELSGGVHRTRRARIHEFLFDDPARPSRDYRSEAVLPTFAASSEWFHSRSDWTADATAVSFFSAQGLQVTSHQHRDQNSFVVWHKGWQAADLNSWSGSGVADDTLIHNTLLLNGEGQRTPILDPRFRSHDPGYGRIVAVHDSTTVRGLRAVVGDAAAAYGAPGEIGPPVRRTLHRFDRLLVHYGNIVVVGDSVVTTNGAADAITYAVHSAGSFNPTGDSRTYVTASPCGESMFTASGCVDTMQGGRMVHTTLVPANPALRVVSQHAGRHSPSIAGSGLYLDVGGPAVVLLNAMAFTDRASGAFPIVESIGASSGFLGARVAHDGRTLLVLLRDDATGARLPVANFHLATAGAHALLVSGLEPGRYRITQPGGGVIEAGMVGEDGFLSAFVAGGGEVRIARVQ